MLVLTPVFDLITQGILDVHISVGVHHLSLSPTLSRPASAQGSIAWPVGNCD